MGILKRIRAQKNYKIAKYPQTCARQFDLLFSSIIKSPRNRMDKLVFLFSGKYAKGDDIYLRLILELCERSQEISSRVTQKYRAEKENLKNKHKR